jgi:hypothetical protein
MPMSGYCGKRAGKETLQACPLSNRNFYLTGWRGTGMGRGRAWRQAKIIARVFFWGGRQAIRQGGRGERVYKPPPAVVTISMPMTRTPA